MKIGILGGTFNPIHLGHLVLADEVKHKLALDKVIFIPANIAPHKEEKDLIDAAHRLKMVKLAVADNPNFEVNDIEIKRRGKSYSIDTIKALNEQYPSSFKLFFILGSDGLNYLDSWKDIKELMKLSKLVAAGRPNYPLRDLPKGVLPVVIESLDISAFRIRQRIRNNEPIKYLLPEKVYSYIAKNNLYK